MALSLRGSQWGQSCSYSFGVDLVASVERIFRLVCIPTEDRGNERILRPSVRSIPMWRYDAIIWEVRGIRRASMTAPLSIMNGRWRHLVRSLEVITLRQKRY